MPEDFLVQAMNVMDMGGQYRQRSDMRGRFYSKSNICLLTLFNKLTVLVTNL